MKTRVETIVELLKERYEPDSVGMKLKKEMKFVNFVNEKLKDGVEVTEITNILNKKINGNLGNPCDTAKF